MKGKLHRYQNHMHFTKSPSTLQENSLSGLGKITHRLREITLSLSQLRIERELEAQRRAEEDRLRAEQERKLQQELVALSREAL